MTSSKQPFRRFLATAISTLLAVQAVFAQEILTIEDQGARRQFVLAEDEVLIKGQTENSDRLKQDIETVVPGARVLETRGREALTKLEQRVDRRKAAARQDALQQAAPELPSEPVLYHKDLTRSVDSRRYVGPRVLVELKDGQTLEQLRTQSGAVQVKASPLPGHALLTFRDGWQSLAASEDLAAKGLKARPLLRRYVGKMHVPNDPFFNDQWHLKNRGQGGGLVGSDANLIPAWDMALGSGVTVVVVDDSLQTTHPDFVGNVPPVGSNLHFDFRNDDSNPAPSASDDAHGTSVGGVIAARGDNGVGVTGAAPEAQMLGIRLIGGFFDAQTAYDALTWEPEGITSSVSNNSWGYNGTGMVNLDPLERQALQDAATLKRGGLGQVTLFAAANNDSVFSGFLNGIPVFTSQDANYQPYANSRFVIGVAANTNFGDHSYYSNRGASVLISAPSNGGSLGIFTTDNTGSSGYNSLLDPGGQPSDLNYTNSFGGTSSATPLTSGVVALMLSKNNLLGYRDVQEILATTARRIDPTDSGWVTNGAGFHFNHAYGAGQVDAAAAVARTQQWDNLPPVQTFSRTATNLPAQITDNSPAAVSRTFDFSTNENLRLEHVEVVIRATHGSRSDLEIALTSPSGTRSILNPIRPRPDLFYTGDDDNDIGGPGGGWVYMTTHNWGENSSGVWTLTARDGRSGGSGTLDSATVRIYGTPAVTQRVRFTQQQVIVAEDSGTVNLGVERLGGSAGIVSVGYAVVGGSATSEDYTLSSGTITFNPGETEKDISVAITDDEIPETSESVYIILTSPTGARLGGSSLCTMVIGANDGNVVTIAPLDRNAAETPSVPVGTPKNPGSFVVTRLVADSEPLVLPLVITGTATNGTDYASIPATVTIPSGLDRAVITVAPIDDESTEGIETVTITLPNPDPAAEYELGEPREATVILADNEIPNVKILSDKSQLPESGTTAATLTISRDAGATTEVTANLLIGGSAQPGLDYFELPDSVTFLAGETEKTLTLTPIPNEVFNPARTVVVLVGEGLGYVQGFQKEVKIQINNDEPAPDPKIPVVAIQDPSKNEKFNVPFGTLVASGSARDNLNVARVLYRVNAGDWQISTLSDTGANRTWTGDITTLVRPGPNLLEVQAEDDDGNFSLVASRPFTVVQLRTLTVEVPPPGGGTVNPGTGTFEAGQPYKLTAKPQKGFIFAGWTGDLSGSGEILLFTMPDADATVVATFVPNPFEDAVVGRYAGTVVGTTPAPETTGLIDLTVAKAGTFSAKIIYGGKAYKLKGEINGHGKFDGLIKRPKQTPLSVSFTLDLDPEGSQTITGTVTGDSDPSPFIAARAPYSKSNPLSADFAHSYTFYLPPKVPTTIPGDQLSGLMPHGNGVATLSISSTGVVKWTGTLGDGTAAAQTTVISGQKTWPLYVPLYKTTGYISGKVTHDPAALAHDLSATVDWVKPRNDKDRMFPNGFVIEENALLGENFTPPQSGQRVLTGFDSGPLTLDDGNLNAAGIDKVLTISTKHKATIQPADPEKLRLSINTKTGAFNGSFLFQVPRKSTPIKGVILQNKIGKGVGVFTGSVLENGVPQTGRLEFRTLTE